jgi:methionyl-tRNA synthetase
MASFEDFSKLDLRIGKICSVQNHPNADKLYVLEVDIGEKTIQLVAGLRTRYNPDELQGQLIVVVANLEPRMLRGVESQGMLLAAQDENTLGILIPQRPVKPGSIIK